VATARKPFLSIAPPRGLAQLNLAEAWQYRELVRTFARREILVRYRQTILGVFWVVLQPLLMAGIASFIFGRIAGFAKDNPGYFLTAFSGQIAWTVYGLSIFKISTSLVGNSAMLSKVFFPRLTLPVASMLAAQLDTLVSLGAFALLLPLFHHAPTLALLTLPFWFLGLALMSLGVGMLTAALMVSYRDVQFVLPFALNALNLFSPVQWPLAKIGEHLQNPLLLQLYTIFNPVATLIEGFRWALLGGELSVSVGQIVYAAIASVITLFFGALVFRHQERTFADVI
jgi:lipopolysaccharide transport system permease protein